MYSSSGRRKLWGFRLRTDTPDCRALGTLLLHRQTPLDLFLPFLSGLSPLLLALISSCRSFWLSLRALVQIYVDVRLFVSCFWAFFHFLSMLALMTVLIAVVCDSGWAGCSALIRFVVVVGFLPLASLLPPFVALPECN